MILKKFIAAIQFLTILPIGKPGTFDKDMVSFFPLTGLLLGLLLSGFDMIISFLWPEPVPALLDVIFLAVITGALHLDGLADTADGLYGNRPKEKALAIMKDSRVGAMGLVAVICGLSLKWGGITTMDDYRSLFLLIIPAYARGAMVFGFRFLRYGRDEEGTGYSLSGNSPKLSAFWGLLIPICLSFISGWQGILLNMAFVSLVILILTYYKKQMGCITGDMFGAMCEITESGLFLVAAI